MRSRQRYVVKRLSRVLGSEGVVKDGLEQRRLEVFSLLESSKLRDAFRATSSGGWHVSDENGNDRFRKRLFAPCLAMGTSPHLPPLVHSSTGDRQA